jgi:hypothetical protein
VQDLDQGTDSSGRRRARLVDVDGLKLALAKVALVKLTSKVITVIEKERSGLSGRRAADMCQPVEDEDVLAQGKVDGAQCVLHLRLLSLKSDGGKVTRKITWIPRNFLSVEQHRERVASIIGLVHLTDLKRVVDEVVMQNLGKMNKREHRNDKQNVASRQRPARGRPRHSRTEARAGQAQ